MVGKKAELGLLKMVQKWFKQSTTNVPKITVVIGGSFGAGNYVMGKVLSNGIFMMWPTLNICNGRFPSAKGHLKKRPGIIK